jgi:hypothetical protein
MAELTETISALHKKENKKNAKRYKTFCTKIEKIERKLYYTLKFGFTQISFDGNISPEIHLSLSET